MDPAQTWTIIGVLSATLLGFATLTVTTLRGEMRANFLRLEEKIDRLDRDVSALMRHVFGIDRSSWDRPAE